jgi:hypothetical protein
LNEAREKAYEEMERAKAEKIKAEETHGKAIAAWSDSNSRAQGRETKIRHLNAEIDKLREGQDG